MPKTCYDYLDIEPYLLQQIEFLSEFFNKKYKAVISTFLEKAGYMSGYLKKDDSELVEIINEIKILKNKIHFTKNILNLKIELQRLCSYLTSQGKPCNFSEEDFRPLIIAFLLKKYIDEKLKPILNKNNVEDIIINPHLATLFGLHRINDERTLENLIRFELMQHLTRSIVTSWGNFVEKLLHYSGAPILNNKEFENLEIYQYLKKKMKDNQLKGANFDLLKIKNSSKDIYCYWFQIKSGPNTVNQQMAEGFIRLFKLLKLLTKEVEGNHEFLLGLTYGNKNLLSSQTQTFVKEGIPVLAGRELWDFLSEKENFYRMVLELIEIISQVFLGENFNIFCSIENTVKQLKSLWIQKYGLNADLWELFM
jgi:hypothetical protein